MFKMKDKKAFIFYFLMTLIFVDFGNQLRKISCLPEIQNFDNKFFSIMHIYNTGGAFSILRQHTLFLIIFSILALCYIAFHVYKEVDFNDKMSLFSLTLFTAGTLGNLIERIQAGKVLDYIKLNFINFPVFNAFDIMICVGIALYMIFVLFEFKIPLINKKASNEKN